MATEERATAKLLFVENNHTMVRNFTTLIIHSNTGERFELKCFTGWVELVTGSGENRDLHVLLSPKDTERLARGYLKASRQWKRDAKVFGSVFVVAWLLRGLLIVFH